MGSAQAKVRSMHATSTRSLARRKLYAATLLAQVRNLYRECILSCLSRVVSPCRWARKPCIHNSNETHESSDYPRGRDRCYGCVPAAAPQVLSACCILTSTSLCGPDARAAVQCRGLHGWAIALNSWDRRLENRQNKFELFCRCTGART